MAMRGDGGLKTLSQGRGIGVDEMIIVVIMECGGFGRGDVAGGGNGTRVTRLIKENISGFRILLHAAFAQPEEVLDRARIDLLQAERERSCVGNGGVRRRCRHRITTNARAISRR